MAKAKSIVFLSATADLGGAEFVLLSIAENLDRDKFSATLVTQDNGPLAKGFNAVGHRVVVLKLPAWRRTRNFFIRYLVVWRLHWATRHIPVDLIHCNSYRLTPYALWLRRIRGPRVIVHLHDLLKTKHVRGFGVAKADCIVTVSDFIQAPLSKCATAIRTIYNGIPAAKFISAAKSNFRGEFNIPLSARVLGMLANFKENKRYDLFIRLAAALHRIDNNMYFAVVGHNIWNSPVTEDKLKQAAKDQGLAERVIFTGWRDDCAALLKDFDAVMVPSDFESFSLVIVEAMAAGCPAFAQRNSGGPAEIIEDGRDGFLLDFSDTQLAAEEIMARLNDQANLGRVRLRAREKVLNNFDASVFIRKIEKLYQEMTGASWGQV